MGRALLFIDHATGLGGAEQSLLLLLERLSREHWFPHLACPPGALSERARPFAEGVHLCSMPRLRRNPKALGDWLGVARQLAQIVRQLQAALIITNTVRATFYGALAAGLTRTPLIWYMRDFWLSESRPRYVWLDAQLKLLLCQLAKQVVANSQATAQHLPCNPKKVRIVHNGIAIERFARFSDSSSFRRLYRIPAEAKVVGMVGRLRPWKGQERFLRVFSRVCLRIHEAHALIVGGNPFGTQDDYSKYLLRLASELGISGKVTFTDQLEDVRPALAVMDVFVHPGDPEPFGLVNIEAMAMAKPVIAFAHGALPEIVVDGETGILIPPYDEAAMTGAIVQLLEAPSRRLELGQAGLQRVQAHFTAQKMVTAFEAVLSDALELHSGSRLANSQFRDSA